MDNTFKTKYLILTGLFAALTAIGAYIYIPLPISPVPITLQMFFTFMAGGLLGKKYGFFSQLIYILIGAIGLPVFAGGTGGFGILFGPTGGYVLGFLAAGYIAGFSKDTFISKLLYMLLALIVIYLLGTTRLMMVIQVDFIKALTIGVTPFIIGDLMKVALAAYLSVKLSNYIRY
ncbi:MAG TPA: biotin transporter BioY [Halanaerobiales bacterium]|nr:biotin transporter BioY [Halanaerobiales bacterium]